MNKKISIIIPCYNCSTTLNRCWNAIKSQTMNLEFIEAFFVDDASDDGGATWSTLMEIENEAPDSVNIIHLEQNMRQGGARNTALSYINGKYFLFLDSDDTLNNEACKTLYDIAEESRAEMVLFNCTYCDDKGNSIPRNVYKERTSLYLSDDELRRKTLLGHGLTYGCVDKLYRTDFYKSVGSLFPEHMVYEEPLFVYPLFLYAMRVEIIPDYLYNYFIHSNSTVTEAALLRRGDHPKVQFLLLEWLKKNAPTYLKYRDEIMFYIIWTSFVETLNFTKNDPKSDTAYQFYEYIRSILVSEFPDYARNRYIRMFDRPEIFEFLSNPIDSCETLDKLNTLIKNIFP
ncbi:MAG: glycosyltransferase family 2 protein [Oribacterium sp.]|nr:glycosyltransferase family 2 protein [Oribacterium sp.]